MSSSAADAARSASNESKEPKESKELKESEQSPAEIYWAGICAELGMDKYKYLLPEKPEENKLALELYLKAANKGEAGALYRLGHCYEHGIGIAIDDAAAVEQYKKAAELGNVRAALSMYHCQELGKGGLDKDNREEKEKWLMLSMVPGYSLIDSYADEQCRLEHQISESVDSLIRWIAKDLENQKDTTIAGWSRNLLNRLLPISAFSKIHLDAGRIEDETEPALNYKLLLMLCYYYGLGTKRDLKEADELCQKLLQKKHPVAQVLYCVRLNAFLKNVSDENERHKLLKERQEILNEFFKMQSVIHKEQWFTPFCVLNRFRSQTLTSEQLKKVKEAVIRADGRNYLPFNPLSTAYLDAYKNAYDQAFQREGYSTYQRIAASELLLNELHRIKRGVKLQNPVALCQWGYCHLIGLGVKQDTKRALELLKLSCDNGCEMAGDILADCYYHGKYVQPSLRQAYYYDALGYQRFYTMDVASDVPLLFFEIRKHAAPYLTSSGIVSTILDYCDDPKQFPKP